MARGIYLGIDGAARDVTEVYAGVSGVARKVKKAYASVNGVAQQVWPRYTWERYSLKDLITYHWDKYDAIGTTKYTGDVLVTYRSASMVASWTPRFSRNNPPEIDREKMIWDDLGKATWNGIANGEWVVRSTSLSNSCYRVTRVEGLAGADTKFYFDQVASAVTTTTYVKGDNYMGQVSSTNQNAYPANGASGGMWYTPTENTSEKIQGDYIDLVYGDEGEYPDNGILGDYWYVKVER
ncbi:MAG: hypothetical protein IKY91_02000 [Akkermansia sp.]|nr:hypothetical protein [Akkermansia sp.]